MLFLFQKIILDDRFTTDENDPPDCQLAAQLINTFTNITSFSDDIQIEIMKVRYSLELSIFQNIYFK